MADHLASRRSVELSEKDRALVVELCGGHAGLLKATLNLLWNTQQEDGLAEIVLTLVDEPAIQAECKKVWDSLPTSEQVALRALAEGKKPDLSMLRRLERKGLVRQDAGIARLFGPLFADFVRRQAPL